ncbi:hypothetical protein ACNS7O_15620 (plasmid) [Haloferacaceae archaeon DSL9]
MGLKSGSRDAGLDESDDVDQVAEEKLTKAEAEASAETVSAETEGDETEPKDESDATSQRPTMDAIPYKLRRSRVNEGREQVPYFLRSEVISAETELQETLEEILGENVYKSDYREAAMVVAQRNPELIAEVLREWGYDLEGM